MTRPTTLTIRLAQRNAARRPEPEKVSWQEFVSDFTKGFGFVTGAVIMFVVMIGWLR